LKGTIDIGIVLGGKFDIELPITTYCDASFAEDITRFSTAGHVVFIAGGPVYWVSKKQSLVTLSTIEAEFINLTPTGCTLLWITSMLKELGYLKDTKPSIIFTDSRNAMAIALNLYEKQRTRHIDIRYKWVIDRLQKGDFIIKHIDSKNQIANGFTKGLRKDIHIQFVRMLNIQSLSTFSSN
jgi:hypothetical protein